MDNCPCGQELQVKTEISIRLRKEVDVILCECGKIRYVPDVPYHKMKSGHDKFKYLSEQLGADQTQHLPTGSGQRVANNTPQNSPHKTTEV